MTTTGMTHNEIRQLQHGLAAAGYYHGPIDGKASPMTSAAVLAYMRKSEQSAPQPAEDGFVLADTLVIMTTPTAMFLTNGLLRRELNADEVEFYSDLGVRGLEVAEMFASSIPDV